MKLCTLKCAACFNNKAKRLLPLWGRSMTMINDRSKKVLGMEYIPMKDTYVDMAESMIELGLIPDKRKK